jgi:hypothetical protein
VRKNMRNMGVFVAAVLAVIASSVGVAQARNGVQVGQFAYVFENDQWLADIANSAVTPEPPEFIVLNIGNGQTDDVGHLDTIAQSIMARGTKVYGYVDANPSRSNNDIAIDAGRYINPYNPERNNYSRMVDGIFLDQHPRDCGPIETPTNNPSNDSDWIYKYSSITGNVRSQFSFWSYPTALVMANVGTAVNGCHPGWGNFGQPVPDYYVTFEGDAATYASSYLGGNMIDGTPAYVDGNYYFPERFVHIVYDVDAVDVKDTLRLADQRGAHSVYLTDDVASNPYDSPPSYLQQSITDARVSPTTFEDGFSGGSSYGLGSSEVGFGTAYDGFGAVTSQQVFTHDGGGPGVDPSTSPWVARIPKTSVGWPLPMPSGVTSVHLSTATRAALTTTQLCRVWAPLILTLSDVCTIFSWTMVPGCRMSRWPIFAMIMLLLVRYQPIVIVVRLTVPTPRMRM